MILLKRREIVMSPLTCITSFPFFMHLSSQGHLVLAKCLSSYPSLLHCDHLLIIAHIFLLEALTNFKPLTSLFHANNFQYLSYLYFIGFLFSLTPSPRIIVNLNLTISSYQHAMSQHHFLLLSTCHMRLTSHTAHQQ